MVEVKITEILEYLNNEEEAVKACRIHAFRLCGDGSGDISFTDKDLEDMVYTEWDNLEEMEAELCDMWADMQEPEDMVITF